VDTFIQRQLLVLLILEEEEEAEALRLLHRQVRLGVLV
jgi:hypothetical protein